MGRFARSTVAVALALCARTDPADAGLTLRVHGAVRIDGHAGRSHGRLLVEGRVLDDAGSPVPSAGIVLALQNAGSPISPSPTPIDLAGLVSSCGEEHPAAGMPALHSDESGRFCVWISAPLGSYTVRLDAGPTAWLSQGSASYPVDLEKRSVQLRFDPEPRIVSVDAQETSLDVIATSDEDVASDAKRAGASHLPLTLSTEGGAPLAHATTGAGGRATFVFSPHDLGPPGRGSLRVRFDGDTDTMASEHISPIERDAHVTLALTRDAEPSSPEDGIDLDVVTRTIEPAVATGTIEARFGGVLVGAAPLASGRAHTRATFVAPRGTNAAVLQIRYVPDAPWFQSSGDLPAVVPIRPPSPLRQLPLLIGAIAIGAWLLLGRTARRQRLDRTIMMERPPLHEGTAGVSVVHSSRSRTGTYSGRVVDAHDGTAVARARISVQIPTFLSAPPLASVFANDQGEFSFDLGSAPPDAELVVEAPLHADLRQKLPGAGVLEIALVSRRRKLLERLVQWARRRGPPFDIRPEPTPAQVRRAAENAMPGAAAWANAIEQAAFDRGDVDARVESEVLALEPTPGEAARAQGGPAHEVAAGKADPTGRR